MLVFLWFSRISSWWRAKICGKANQKRYFYWNIVKLFFFAALSYATSDDDNDDIFFWINLPVLTICNRNRFLVSGGSKDFRFCDSVILSNVERWLMSTWTNYSGSGGAWVVDTSSGLFYLTRFCFTHFITNHNYHLSFHSLRAWLLKKFELVTFHINFPFWQRQNILRLEIECPKRTNKSVRLLTATCWLIPYLNLIDNHRNRS